MEIGTKIKELRLKNNLTQEELGDRCELTKGFISQLENDLTTPSIDTLNDIVTILGSNLSEFFDERKEDPVVFKKDDYFVKESDDGSSVTWLVPSAQKNEMEPIFVTLPPHTESERDIPHEGEEFGYVLSGRIKLLLGKKSYTVCKGETFYYKADKTHLLVNDTDKNCEVLWISCPPNF